MEQVRHFVSGGWWSKADSDGSYVSAGEKVQSILQDNKSLSHRLGFSTSGNSNPGKSLLVIIAHFIQERPWQEPLKASRNHLSKTAVIQGLYW
jgi:hypothetical protein